MEGHCELCGAYGHLSSYVIENSPMQVCRDCGRFGKRERSPTQLRAIHAKLNSSAFKAKVKTFQQDIKRQKQDRFDLESGERVIDDWVPVLRGLLGRHELSPEVLAKKINEKASYISSVVSGQLRPSIATAKKIERQYKVTLVEAFDNRSAGTVARVVHKGDAASSGLTFGDLIRKQQGGR